MILHLFTLFNWGLYCLFETLHFFCLFICQSNTFFGMVMIARYFVLPSFGLMLISSYMPIQITLLLHHLSYEDQQPIRLFYYRPSQL